MRIVIVYSSHAPEVLRVARDVQDRLAETRPDDDVELADLDFRISPHLDDADAVVLGAEVRGATDPSPVASYAQSHADELAGRRLGLFLTAPAGRGGDPAALEAGVAAVVSRDLLDHASAAAVFGPDFRHEEPTVWHRVELPGPGFAGVRLRAGELTARTIDSFVAALTAPAPDTTA